MPYLSKLHETVCRFPTDYWNDSCSITELAYAVGNGASGATTNPTIVLQVLAKETRLWADRIAAQVAAQPTWSERELGWWLVEEMAKAGAVVLHPIFVREGGRKGRLSAQTDPALYRDPDRLLAHALRLAALAPNMQVKIPATAAGLRAIEEATWQGVSVNATVCFTVPQALAVGAAIERGFDRRADVGLDSSAMAPVCTLMVGRLDDWIKILYGREAGPCEPRDPDWAGIAVFKRALGLFQERGYRARLLAAAYRHLGHWSELCGGDVVLTIPYEWQVRINESDIPVEDRIGQPVDPAIVDRLLRAFPDFARAWEPEGLCPAEFDGYGATARTLRGFIQSTHDLQAKVRDALLPDPDRRR